MLVGYQSLDHDVFMLDDQPLNIEVEDIYFIIGIYRRDEMVNMRSRGGVRMAIDEYITTYCAPGTYNEGTKIPIRNVKILSLNIILFTISQVVG
jgi:hypothetical protein